jgi:hypothetical protein
MNSSLNFQDQKGDTAVKDTAIQRRKAMRWSEVCLRAIPMQGLYSTFNKAYFAFRKVCRATSKTCRNPLAWFLGIVLS